MHRKILIIEDEKEMAQLMSWRLTQADFESRVAYDGRAGLTALNEEEPDLILTDIVMPGMDGHELCCQLQKKGVLSRIPVIVLTAFSNRIDDFHDIKIQEFLVKPVDSHKLIETIERVIKRTSHWKKTKTILLQGDPNPGIEEAIQQFENMGYPVKVEFLTEDVNIEQVLRTNPHLLILDASRPGVETDRIVRSLRSYVILKDMVILFYQKDKKEKKKPKGWFKRKDNSSAELEDIKNRCLQAGAAKYLESLDRETFLSALKEYCLI